MCLILLDHYIEKGIKEFATAIEGLKLGEYLDITVEYRIGDGAWNAVTKTKSEIELSIELSDELRKDNAEEYYIIRAHEGALVLLFDTDKDTDIITFSTDRFSTYALSYTEMPQNDTQNGEHSCPICGWCPQPLGICILIWLLIIITAIIIIWIILKRKSKGFYQRP